jgi:hypothetical protein
MGVSRLSRTSQAASTGDTRSVATLAYRPILFMAAGAYRSGRVTAGAGRRLGLGRSAAVRLFLPPHHDGAGPPGSQQLARAAPRNCLPDGGRGPVLWLRAVGHAAVFVLGTACPARTESLKRQCHAGATVIAWNPRWH